MAWHRIIIIIIIIIVVVIIIVMPVVLNLGQNFIMHHCVGGQQDQDCLQQFQLLESILH